MNIQHKKDSFIEFLNDKMEGWNWLCVSDVDILETEIEESEL